MAARDEFPMLAFFAEGASGGDGDLVGRRREAAAALDEIDRLRRWKAEATEVLAGWEQVWEHAGRPGRLAVSKHKGVIDYLDRLRLDCAYMEDIARCRGEENETLRQMNAELTRRAAAPVPKETPT